MDEATAPAVGGPPDPAADEDPRLVTVLATGDADALEEIYRRHGAVCYRLARRVTASPVLAEDCVQETFLALWRRPDRFDAATGTLRSWLLAMTHHKAVDAVRRETAQQRRQAAESTMRRLDPLGTDPEESAWQAIRDEGVRRALAALPAAQRQAIALAYYGGLSQSEIARRTGVPLGTVKTRMLAGMRRLRGTLTPAIGPDEAAGGAR